MMRNSRDNAFSLISDHVLYVVHIHMISSEVRLHIKIQFYWPLLTDL